MTKPLPGKKFFEALKDHNSIIIAANIRIIPGVARGIFRAAKDMNSALICELARTECNQHTGYTGLTPATYSKYLQEASDEVGFDCWILHADHIQIKKGTPEEIADVKDLIEHQIKAGYTSFAIDASHLFNFEGKSVEEELEPNLKATIEVAHFIQEKFGNNEFGLEVEVGEIGRTDSEGMILTKPEEAVAYIKKLHEEKIYPNLIAIANGSTHGNVYDDDGNLIPLVTINIEQTKEVAKALRDNGFDVAIAQHGITGTPIELIKEKFPLGDIRKGNVATLFQNIVFDKLKQYHPELYEKMLNWTIENKPIEGKKPNEVFGKNGKHAVKQFFNEVYAMSDECKKAIEEECYNETKAFMDAFNSKDTADIVKKHFEG